jgi:hypothetical protein
MKNDFYQGRHGRLKGRTAENHQFHQKSATHALSSCTSQPIPPVGTKQFYWEIAPFGAESCAGRQRSPTLVGWAELPLRHFSSESFRSETRENSFPRRWKYLRLDSRPKIGTNARPDRLSRTN